MTEFTSKGGKFIIQDDGQKGLESTYLDLFAHTKEGKDWFAKNEITTKTSDESPDFTFKTTDDRTIGLEITNFIVKSGEYHAAKHLSTATLKTIAEQVCKHFKKEKGISLSIIIDIYDSRKWSGNWNDHLSYCYDPGFKHFDASKKDIKNAIIEVLSQETIPSFGVVKKWIDIGTQKFCISASRMYEPHTSAHVNNEGMCKEDPFEELQAVINAKNDKYEKYKNKCSECDLLVVSDDNSTGNFAWFTDKLKNHEFKSVFRDVYLLDLSANSKTTKLKTSI